MTLMSAKVWDGNGNKAEITVTEYTTKKDLLKAVKELIQQVEKLKSEIEKLKNGNKS